MRRYLLLFQHTLACLLLSPLIINLLADTKSSIAAMPSSPSTSSRVARAAIAQLCSTNNKMSNLLNIAKCAGWAKRDGASMLFLPECFGFMGENAAETVRNAESPIETLLDVEKKKINEQQDDAMKSIREVLATTVLNYSKCKVNDDDTINENNKDMLENHINQMKDENTNESFLLNGLRAIARESGLWISGGGMHVSGAPSSPPPPSLTATNEEKSSSTATPTPQYSRVYNTHIIIDNAGKINCFYHKSHLFDVSIPGKVQLKESATTAPGTKLMICDSPLGRLGLSTCYDVRFPEMYVELVQRGGAEILLVPSAFTVPTGRAHWHTLLRARAIENQCYVLAAAQFGKHNERRESYGHSIAINPWGDILADAGGCDGPGTTVTGNNDDDREEVEWNEKTPSIITCDIDLDFLQTIRERMPIQQHRDDSNFTF
mmetsp:Transcript_17172/g.23017  ORF Transcript_17172/g.23017 Transcript_17172/m.23017 type:complete len:433 (-) Transcript_17172:200-1498(-)